MFDLSLPNIDPNFTSAQKKSSFVITGQLLTLHTYVGIVIPVLSFLTSHAQGQNQMRCLFVILALGLVRLSLYHQFITQSEHSQSKKGMS